MRLASTDTLTGTAAALGSVGTRWADRAVARITGLTSETISVTGSIAGAVVTEALRPINLATGITEATDSLLSNGTFLFDNLCYDTLIFTKSSTSDPAVVTVRTA
jgi:hypothetical protein